MNSADFKTRVFAFAGTVLFLFVAPGTVAGLIPWWIGKWQVHVPFFGFTALRVAGVLLMAAGFVILIEAFLRFALKGIGTPAPIFPTRRLVVTGSYRYVRNPMYVSVVSLILGQSLLFGEIRVLAFGLLGGSFFTSLCWRTRNQRCADRSPMNIRLLLRTFLDGFRASRRGMRAHDLYW